MAPPNPVPTTANLHALTERLASHGQSLSPLMSSKLAASLANFSPTTLAAAAAQYRQPAPPPALPVLQLVGRHQDPVTDKNPDTPSAPPWQDTGNGEDWGHVPGEKCPGGINWSGVDEHLEVRCGTMDDNDLEGFVADMAIVMRREFDCWVEQCWTEAFHYLFTRTLPTLVIHLILTGATPQFLRRSIVHGGWALDTLFQTQMLDLLYTELELRLSGARPPEPTTTKSSGPSAASIPGLNGPAPVQPINPIPTRDGICFHNMSYEHGYPLEEDDHCACLCQLTSCLRCFEISAMHRKGPTSLLPYELRDTITAEGWSGGIETPDQARIRLEGLRPANIRIQQLPPGKGFVRNPKTNAAAGGSNVYRSGPPLFPHPQMTDVLAVEEHLRWRLKELGANDPAVEARYGPSRNDPLALDGVELPDESEDGDSQSGTGPNATQPPTTGVGGKKGGKVVKVTRGKGKVRRVVNGGVAGKGGEKKKDGKNGTVAGGGAVCYLPKEWAEEDPQVRNMAVVLTFRHFVKLLHQISTSVSPFSYPSYSQDIEELERVHPIALYKRLAEPAVSRRKDSRHARAWAECMERWGEELGAREKTRGNMLVNDNRHAEAVEYYTRALSLDPKKTVYLSNRAVALNTLGYHPQAELDCNLILAKDGKNGKAFYQRALARRGQGRVREAEADLREVLRYQPGNESAKRLMGIVKGEVAKLPKLSAKEALEF